MVIVVVVVVMIKYLVMLAACCPGSSSMASACAGSLALLDAGTHCNLVVPCVLEYRADTVSLQSDLLLNLTPKEF